MRRFTLSLCAVALWAPATLARLYTLANNCPQTINWYLSGLNVTQGSVAKGATITQEVEEIWSGFVYTDANGGSADGKGSTKAGFYGEGDMYYIVVDSPRINAGIRIEPQAPINNGFCVPDTCDTNLCPSVMEQPPTAFPPVSTTTPPTPPTYACPGDKIGYKVTFCPDGAFPPVNGFAVAIHPNGNTAKCLDVRGNVWANGTPVQIYDCNETQAQKWRISAGSTHVRLDDSNFCLDAGSSPANGVGMKIWQCYEGLPAQSWTYTQNKHLQLSGTAQCLDLTDGSTANSNKVQTWECSASNTNQVWTFP
ncbi:putative G-X-X-X-Q-X-W domain-containing protein [Lyophyllum shimeji]|uniref:G-X-X-X-Q-X-W domain-containing protein n=1 Tax=Lyophyllum shimeji TaxID=47721 RepID=A0A9P3Q1H6_LYOSH|nr:putative G-X-X-X-Q-X-W domain-containing protein [Lyophyllum shimeji]